MSSVGYAVVAIGLLTTDANALINYIGVFYFIVCGTYIHYRTTQKEI